MPIDRGEFDRDRPRASSALYELLSSNPDLAFNAEELARLLAGGDATRDSTVELERLVAQGLAVRRDLDGRRWYAAVRSRSGSSTG